MKKILTTFLCVLLVGCADPFSPGKDSPAKKGTPDGDGVIIEEDTTIHEYEYEFVIGKTGGGHE